MVAAGDGLPRERRHAGDMKTGAIKQIEAWAKSGRQQTIECGRNVGKLNDNVTEERMLQARIWDLSRERYKFLSQAEYEKRTFLDRQLRKSAICREITKNLEGGGKNGAVGGADGCCEMKRALERRESVKSLNRGGSQIRDPAADRARSGSATFQLPTVVQRSRRGRPAAGRTPISTSSSRLDDDDDANLLGAPDVDDSIPDRKRSGMFTTEPTHPLRYKSSLAMREALGADIRSAPVKRRISFAADRPDRDHRALDGHYISSRLPERHPGTDVKPLDDPRYRLLESCLCEQWNRKGVYAAPEVAGVIRNNPSLYIPPKRGRDRKSSTAIKFLRLLSEQGWVF